MAFQRKVVSIILSTLLALMISQVGARAHGPGPGMVITCTSSVSGVPFGANAGVTVRNAATGQIGNVAMANGTPSGGVCTDIMLAATQAGLRAGMENMNSVAVYGAGNSVTVSFATISQQNF